TSLFTTLRHPTGCKSSLSLYTLAQNQAGVLSPQPGNFRGSPVRDRGVRDPSLGVPAATIEPLVAAPVRNERDIKPLCGSTLQKTPVGAAASGRPISNELKRAFLISPNRGHF